MCCLSRDCLLSLRQSIPPSVCRGMVIHSSHMQIVAVRLGRPWERIKASGLGSPSILPSSLTILPPQPPAHHPLPAASSCCSVLYPPLTHLPFLPPGKSPISGVCWLSGEVEGRLRKEPIRFLYMCVLICMHVTYNSLCCLCICVHV